MKHLLKITEAEDVGLKACFANFNKREKTDREIFYALCFCICSPQTKFENNNKAMRDLISWKFYDRDIKDFEADIISRCFVSATQILSDILRPVRFYNNKARCLIEMKKKFKEILWKVSTKTENSNGIYFKRDWLVENVKGLGYKTASHFLRNLGDIELAILDTHIIKFLAEQFCVEWKVNYEDAVNLLRKAVTRKNSYLDAEKLFQEIAKENKLNTAEFDALIWKRYSGIKWEDYKW